MALFYLRRCSIKKGVKLWRQRITSYHNWNTICSTRKERAEERSSSYGGWIRMRWSTWEGLPMWSLTCTKSIRRSALDTASRPHRKQWSVSFMRRNLPRFWLWTRRMSPTAEMLVLTRFLTSSKSIWIPLNKVKFSSKGPAGNAGSNSF